MATTSATFPTPTPTVTRVRPVWHRVYFLLAAFDVLTVSLSLYLNHRIMGIYTRSVAVNQAWVELLHDTSELGQLAAAVNAPGNDVFATRRVDEEQRRMRQASRRFEEYAGGLHACVVALADADQAAVLSQDLRGVEAATAKMTGEGDQIFAALRDNQLAEAGRRMAGMDREYDVVNTGLVRLRR